MSPVLATPTNTKILISAPTQMAAKFLKLPAQLPVEAQNSAPKTTAPLSALVRAVPTVVVPTLMAAFVAQPRASMSLSGFATMAV